MSPVALVSASSRFINFSYELISVASTKRKLSVKNWADRPYFQLLQLHWSLAYKFQLAGSLVEKFQQQEALFQLTRSLVSADKGGRGCHLLTGTLDADGSLLSADEDSWDSWGGEGLEPGHTPRPRSHPRSQVTPTSFSPHQYICSPQQLRVGGGEGGLLYLVWKGAFVYPSAGVERGLLISEIEREKKKERPFSYLSRGSSHGQTSSCEVRPWGHQKKRNEFEKK